jgi:predicted metal-dependent hydrolase
MLKKFIGYFQSSNSRLSTDMENMIIGNMKVDVERKAIKNIHLSVYPPAGRIRISAPLRIDLDTLRMYTISKMSWIRKQQKKFLGQKRETPREYITRESHYFMGNRYLLKVLEQEAPPKVEIKHETIEMYVRPHANKKKRQEVLDEWYRQNLKAMIPEIIDRYERIMKVTVAEFGVKKMRTKWGTCNRQAKRIWLNLELAKKPKHYLEYIIVHEMVHLLERNHNDRFIASMDKFMPQWRQYKAELNRLSLGHESWGY